MYTLHNNFIYMAKESSFSFYWNMFFGYYVTHSVMCIDFFQIIKVKPNLIIFGKSQYFRRSTHGVLCKKPMIVLPVFFFFNFSAKQFGLRVDFIYEKKSIYQANVCYLEFEFI